MKAVIFDHELKCIDTYPEPEALENEALIRVRMAGICNTDLEIIKGYKGFTGVVGHEFVGVVERIKTKDQRFLNRRVVGEIQCVCGACDYCLRGLRKHCLDRKTLGISGKDGALAEFVTLPAENLFPVPDDISDEEAVFTEPLAAAIEVTRQVRIGPDDHILVMGDGKLGILTALVLKHSYDSVTLLGKHEHKLQIAENKGIQTILLEDPNVKKYFDIVVEATGSPHGFDIAMQMVKPRGTIVLKSTVAEYSRMNVSPLVTDEITVMGSRCGPFGAALDTLSMKQVDVRSLISGIYTFDSAEEAFKKAREDDSFKILIDFRNC